MYTILGLCIASECPHPNSSPLPSLPPGPTVAAAVTQGGAGAPPGPSAGGPGPHGGGYEIVFEVVVRTAREKGKSSYFGYRSCNKKLSFLFVVLGHGRCHGPGLISTARACRVEYRKFTLSSPVTEITAQSRSHQIGFVCLH